MEMGRIAEKGANDKAKSAYQKDHKYSKNDWDGARNGSLKRKSSQIKRNRTDNGTFAYRYQDLACNKPNKGAINAQKMKREQHHESRNKNRDPVGGQLEKGRAFQSKQHRADEGHNDQNTVSCELNSDFGRST